MEILLVLFIILAGSYILGELFFRYLKLPKVIGPIIFGFILNLPVIREAMFPVGSPVLNILATFKEVAVIFLLFFVGLKIDMRDFIKSSKRSAFVAVTAFVVPFIGGFLFGKLVGFSNLTSVVIGACLSVSAEAVAIEILEELKLLRSKVGEVIIEAGIIDDIMGLIIIIFITTVITTEAGIKIGLIKITLEFLLFALIILFIRYYLVGRLLDYVESKHNKIDLFAASLMITLFLAALASYLEIGTIIGAMIAGILIRHYLLTGKEHKAEKRKQEQDITEVTEITTFGFLAPFFFVWIGLTTDLSILIKNPVFVTGLIIIAMLGKIFGSMLGNKLARGNSFEGPIIGWAMNTRGAVELIIASIALDHGLISLDLFSALIFMAFVTTVTSPIVFKILVKKHHSVYGIN